MKSLLRKAEYARLGKVSIDGKILDIGGSTKSGYQELIQGTHEFETANIDASYGADIVFDAEEAWPVEAGSYDAVLFINLLEHLYKYDVAVREAYKALRSGGRVIGVVPFMYNVHGSPDDYFRYTKSALVRILTDAGFTDISVEELGTGGVSVAYHSLLGLLPFRWLHGPLGAGAGALDRMLERMRPGNGMSRAAMPLGYYFEARR